ncbi:Folylpolyglutamate synthase [Linum perenne]
MVVGQFGGGGRSLAGGNTLGEIAGEKAGILKVDLQVVHPLDANLLNGLKLGLEGEHQYVNAGLAIALFFNWLKRTVLREQGSLPEQFIKGLTTASFQGRAQIVRDEYVLLFNCMTVRDPQLLLPPLFQTCASQGVYFKKALFVPNMSVYHKVGSHAVPSTDAKVDLSWQSALQRVWANATKNKNGREANVSEDDSGATMGSSEKKSTVFSSLPLAIKWLRDSVRQNQSVRLQNALAVIDSSYSISGRPLETGYDEIALSTDSVHFP